jgi:antitoxin component YwqK of YwqJK toxin-antitoxin module
MKRALLIIFCALILTGCTVRRISDGKPPKDGVVQREMVDQIHGPLRGEDRYENGVLVRTEMRFKNGKRALERFYGVNDSTVYYFRTGHTMHILVTNVQGIISYRENFEDGTVRIESDTSYTTEYYRNGTIASRMQYQNGLITTVDRWFENGKRAEHSEWLNDARNGKRMEWDSTGRVLIDERYEHNVKIQ